MLELLKDVAAAVSLATIALALIAPPLWRAFRCLLRQGFLFALISCGFLVSMADKPVPQPPTPPPSSEKTAYEIETGRSVSVALDLEALFGDEVARMKSVVVKGLPSGLKHKDGAIAGRATKSGVFVANVRLTTTDGRTIEREIDLVVRAEGEHVVLVGCDATLGKVSGTGVYAEGRKVSLNATANRGYVFTGWQAEGAFVSPHASYAFVMPAADIELAASFATVEADRDAIAAHLEGLGVDFTADAATAATNVMAGMYLEWPVSSVALSDTTVKVSGLPAGLKFTAKDVYVKGSKTEVAVPANTIYGVPTSVSRPGKPSVAKITVTTAGKARREFALSLTVDAPPAWAAGTFNGGSSVGQVSLAIANTGKMSGKWLSAGRTWTLSANGYDALHEESAGMHETLFATLRAKSGGETMEIVTGITPYGLTGYDGTGILFVADRFDWKTGALKSLSARIAKAPALDAEVDGFQPGVLTLKFGANGVVKVNGRFTVDEETGRKVSVSGTSVLCPSDGGLAAFSVYVYLQPKGAFEGCSDVLDLVWNGTSFDVRR